MGTQSIIAVGIVSYETPWGFTNFKSIFAEHITNEYWRHFSKNWHIFKKFSKHCKKWQDDLSRRQVEKAFRSMKKNCWVIHTLAHTLMCLIPLHHKAHLKESQENGINMSEKSDQIGGRLKQQVPKNQLAKQDEITFVNQVNKSKSYRGITSDWQFKKCCPQKYTQSFL